VIAANDSGVWNEVGDTLAFSLAPAYYQTDWFRAGCVAAFFATLWGLYRLRLLQLSREFNAQLDGRVEERTRIARELHDTMLQTFQGATMKLHVVMNLLPKRPAEAESLLGSVIKQALQAIHEGRDAVQGLRSSMLANDLARAVQLLGEELLADPSLANRPGFSVTVEGESRHLAPLVREDIHRISCEAVRNAFHHAKATRIEVQIHYTRRLLRIWVGDNGKGVDPAILNEGRAGHYGLPGMHERAKLIGGALLIRSQPVRGTEVELRIPASRAYAKTAN
jgi:signal transduction histidine kinase